MNAPEWLTDLCDESRAGVQMPFGATVGGVSYAVATDGQRLIAFADMSCDGETTEGVARHLPALIGARPTERVIGQTTVAALRMWAGSPERDATDVCRECKGSGTVKCDECHGYGGAHCPCCNQSVECEDCCDTGEVACEHDAPRRIGLIEGQPFNRFLLALPMHRLADGPVEVCMDSFDGRSPFPFARLKGDGWVIALMGLNLAGELGSGPHIPVEVPA